MLGTGDEDTAGSIPTMLRTNSSKKFKSMFDPHTSRESCCTLSVMPPVISAFFAKYPFHVSVLDEQHFIFSF